MIYDGNSFTAGFMDINIGVIPNEVCVPKHKVLIMDMLFNTAKRRHKKFESRIRVWKLKQEQTRGIDK